MEREDGEEDIVCLDASFFINDEYSAFSFLHSYTCKSFFLFLTKNIFSFSVMN